MTSFLQWLRPLEVEPTPARVVAPPGPLQLVSLAPATPARHEREARAGAPTGPSRRGSHRLAARGRCKQQWRLRYYENLIPKKGKLHQMRGTLWHLCCAYYETSRLPAAMLPEWYFAKDLYQSLREVGFGYEGLVEHLYHNVLPRYVAQCEEEYATNGLRPLAIEKEVAVRVGDLDPGGPDSTLDDEIVTCAPDLLLTNGSITVVDDYKTKARSYRKDGKLSEWRPTNEYTPDWQVNMNLLLVRTAYPNELVTAFRIRRALTVEPYDFDTHVVAVPDVLYQQTARKIRSYVRRERDLMRVLDAAGPDLGPRVDAQGEPLETISECHWGKFGKCDYLDICTASDDETRRRIAHDSFVRRVVEKEFENDGDADE